MHRRSLDLRDADAVIAEIRRLTQGDYQKLGRWNLSQICEHLTETMRRVMDRSGPRLPWLLRTLFGQPYITRTLRSHRMKTGLPTLKRLRPRTPDNREDPAKIEECLTMLARARDRSGPLPPHPMGDMTLEQWKELQWIHAAHHLGFLVPIQEEEPTGSSRPTEEAGA